MNALLLAACLLAADSKIAGVAYDGDTLADHDRVLVFVEVNKEATEVLHFKPETIKAYVTKELRSVKVPVIDKIEKPGPTIFLSLEISTLKVGPLHTFQVQLTGSQFAKLTHTGKLALVSTWTRSQYGAVGSQATDEIRATVIEECAQFAASWEKSHKPPADVFAPAEKSKD